MVSPCAEGYWQGQPGLYYSQHQRQRLFFPPCQCRVIPGMLWPRASAHQLTAMASEHLTTTYTGWPDTGETCYMPCYNTTSPALRTAACYSASHATACEDASLVPEVSMAMSGATNATPTNAVHSPPAQVQVCPVCQSQLVEVITLLPHCALLLVC